MSPGHRHPGLEARIIQRVLDGFRARRVRSDPNPWKTPSNRCRRCGLVRNSRDHGSRLLRKCHAHLAGHVVSPDVVVAADADVHRPGASSLPVTSPVMVMTMRADWVHPASPPCSSVWPRTAPVGHVAAHQAVAGEDVHEDVGQAGGLRSCLLVMDGREVARCDRAATIQPGRDVDLQGGSFSPMRTLP